MTNKERKEIMDKFCFLIPKEGKASILMGYIDKNNIKQIKLFIKGFGEMMTLIGNSFDNPNPEKLFDLLDEDFIVLLSELIDRYEKEIHPKIYLDNLSLTPIKESETIIKCLNCKNNGNNVFMGNLAHTNDIVLIHKTEYFGDIELYFCHSCNKPFVIFKNNME